MHRMRRAVMEYLYTSRIKTDVLVFFKKRLMEHEESGMDIK